MVRITSLCSMVVKTGLSTDADRYAEPHGDFSARVPVHDFEVARPAVNALFEQIFPPWDPGILNPPPEVAMAGVSMRAAGAFGRSLRAQRRDALHEQFRKTALDELAHRTEGVNLAQWGRDDWYALGSKMLTRADGGPHSAGWLRYQVFEEFVRQKWQELEAMKRSSHSFIRLPPPRAYFTPDVVGVDARLQRLRAAFVAWSSGPLRVHDAPTLAACLAALALVLEHDLASKALVKRVVFNPATLMTVRFRGRYWLEWPLNEAESWTQDRPVFRMAVSSSVVSWLGVARKAGKTLKSWPAMPAAMAAWQNSMPVDWQVGSSLEAMFSKLVDCMRPAIPS